MKLNMLFIIALLFVPFQIRKAQGEECNVINQYYGSEYKGILANNNRLSNNGLQGEPGKRGPKGARGFPGQKGEPSVLHEKTERQVDDNKQEIYHISSSLSNYIALTNQTMENIKVGLSKKASKAESLLMMKRITKLWEAKENFERNFAQLEQLIFAISQKSFRSCTEALNSNKDFDYYLLYINPENSIPVRCKNSNGIVYSIVNHDTEDEIGVTGYEKPGDYKRKLNYKTSLQDIRTFISRHTNCRQFIKYRCRGAKIFRNGHSYWKSHDGVQRLYWGGSDRNGYCACGINGNCINKSYKCNCDLNSADVLTSDEGFLTNKDHLPVIEVSFSDTGAENEIGWHTVGPLECW